MYCITWHRNLALRIILQFQPGVFPINVIIVPLWVVITSTVEIQGNEDSVKSVYIMVTVSSLLQLLNKHESFQTLASESDSKKTQTVAAETDIMMNAFCSLSSILWDVSHYLFLFLIFILVFVSTANVVNAKLAELYGKYTRLKCTYLRNI